MLNSIRKQQIFEFAGKFEDMLAKRVSIITSAAGVVLGLLGLFLPWGEWMWRPPSGEWSIVLGINNMLGWFSLIGLLLATLSWVLFKAKRQKFSPMLAMVGGIVIMMSAFAWIASPGALLYTGWSKDYIASYGAYVSFVGGALTFAGAASVL